MKWMVVLLAASAAALAFLTLERARELGRRPVLFKSIESLQDDPVILAEVVKQLAADSRGVFDSHPDRDVVRILQPNLVDETYLDQPLTTNRWGMREVDYELPKPEGVCRIVLLGDSFIFGNGARAEDRAGAFLREYVEQKKGADAPEVEVLSLGIGSWDVVSEAEYVRRQLELLQPDLVLHVTVSNDLDDTHGTRGWGSLANMVPRMPEHTTGRVNVRHPTNYDFRVGNHLCFPIGWEAQHRFDELTTYAGRLGKEIERWGGRYLLVVYWSRLNVHLPPFLANKLRSDQLAFIPSAIQENKAYWLNDSDPHWGRAGGERIAQLFYGIIRNRELLEELALEPWPEVEASTREDLRNGIAQVQQTFPYQHLKASLPLHPKVTFSAERPTGDEELRLLQEYLIQVYTGIDDVGNVAPYASLLLAPDGFKRLVLRGRFFDRPEIDGGTVEVFIGAEHLHTIPIEAGKELDLELALPDGLAPQMYVNVRFRSSDWIYGGATLRDCISFRVDSIGIE